MQTLKQVYYLLLTIVGMLYLPYLGAWIYYHVYYNESFPDDFFSYPPLSAPDKAAFNIFIFSGAAAISLALVLLYIFPSLFGFKRISVQADPPMPKKALPIWFWAGLIAWGVTLFVLWGKFSEPKWLLNWSFIPLSWGFTLMLDGWVYVRTGGKSLIISSPREIIGIGVAATSGWMLFEYLNFFVDENWYYFNGNSIPGDEFTVYAIVGSSGLMPAIFELYNLMNTFPAFRHRYDKGPKIALSKGIRLVILVAGLFGMFAIGFFPDGMFAVLWVSPLLIISVVLENMGIWTPITPLKNGNWSPLLKYGLAYVIFGFLLECWNYYGGIHDPSDPDHIITFTPAYWVYSVPYVSKFHVFEMPLVGYLGYWPFGVYCAAWWISFAFLLNIPTQFAQDEYSAPQSLKS